MKITGFWGHAEIYDESKNLISARMEVGSNCGLRLQVCSTAAVMKFIKENLDADKVAFVDILIYTKISEDDEKYFGFIDENERRMFLELIKLDRLGPATAIKILGFPIDLITSKVITGDWKFFSMISGIGQTTAKNIILELQKKYMKRSNA